MTRADRFKKREIWHLYYGGEIGSQPTAMYLHLERMTDGPKEPSYSKEEETLEDNVPVNFRWNRAVELTP